MTRREVGVRLSVLAVGSVLVLSLSQCTSGGSGPSSSPPPSSHSSSPSSRSSSTSSSPSPTSTEPAGQFTVAFAGDVHFSGRIAPRLAANPATVFAEARQAQLRRPTPLGSSTFRHSSVSATENT